jgi:hypothetical protein
MPYLIPCKYCINFLCKLSLFQKTELLLRDQIFSFGQSSDAGSGKPALPRERGKREVKTVRRRTWDDVMTNGRPPCGLGR